MDSQTTNRILLPILSLIALRRTFATMIENVNGVPKRIGSDVPHAIWTNVELEMEPSQLALYARLHHSAAPFLGSGIHEKMQQALRNLAHHRRLCHGVVNPMMDNFFKA